MTRTAPVAPATTLSQRLKAWTLFVGLFAGGGGMTYFTAGRLVGVVHGLTTRAPRLELTPSDARGLFAGLALLIMSSMLLMPVPEWARGGPRRRRRRGEPKPYDWAASIMGAALVCMVLCFIAPLFVSVAVDDAAVERGYRLCSSPSDEHRPPMRWIREGTPSRCPLSWREADAWDDDAKWRNDIERLAEMGRRRAAVRHWSAGAAAGVPDLP